MSSQGRRPRLDCQTKADNRKTKERRASQGMESSLKNFSWSRTNSRISPTDTFFDCEQRSPRNDFFLTFFKPLVKKCLENLFTSLNWTKKDWILTGSYLDLICILSGSYLDLIWILSGFYRDRIWIVSGFYLNFI